MNKSQLLDPLIHFLSIPSISTQDEYLPDMEKTRHFLKDYLTEMDFQVQFLKGLRHGAVFAQKITNPLLPTVLIYGHYDIQPPEPLDQWQTPPFEPTIKSNKLFARGATDNKGQIMLQMMAVKSLKTSPCNFKFIIEGEEEIGSISVQNLAKKYAKDLLKCDYLIVSDGEMQNGKDPCIEIGMRGLLYTEVSIEIARQDLHSGIFGGVAQNPAIILSHLISKLKDENGHIHIPRFYEDVIHPSLEELADYKALQTTKEEIIKEGQLFGIGGGEKDFSLNERRWSRPTFDINGLISGYTGEGAKTIIPYISCAKISMRLVPNQNADKIYSQFVTFLQKLTPSNCKLTVSKLSSSLPYKSPTHHPIYNVVKKSLKKIFKKEPVFVGVGGSIGFIPVLTKALGDIPAIMVPFGSAGIMHTPNEYISLDNYYKGIEAMKDFYQNLEPNLDKTISK